MPALGEYANVYNSALEVLRQKGYRIWKNERADMFCAEKDGWDFMADGAVALLGLVAMYEFHGPEAYSEYWWKKEGPLDFPNLPTDPPDYDAVWEKKPK
jgi:hypothetical protein